MRFLPAALKSALRTSTASTTRRVCAKPVVRLSGEDYVYSCGRRPMNGAIARFWTLSGWRQAPGRDGSIPTLGCHQLVADYVEVLDRTLDPIGDHHRPPLAPDLFVIDRLVELLVARDRRAVHQHVDDESPPRHTARTHTDTRPHPARRCIGRVGRNGRNSASALGSRGYLYVSAAATSLFAVDLDWRALCRTLFACGHRKRPGRAERR